MTKKVALSEQNHNNLRQDFAILKQRSLNNSELVYLDNAATTQKPEIVIDTLAAFYHLRRNSKNS